MKCRITILLGCACLVAGCVAPRAQFVLLPEADGSVGQISVQNQAGSAEISRQGESVRVADASKAPAPGKTLDQEEIVERYGNTLALLPAPPLAFNLHFGPGSAKLAEDAGAELQRILDAAKQRNSRDISLNGHTDTVGTPEDNLSLSLQRADAVQMQLMEAGLPPEYFTVEYYGESHPAVPTADEVDEPANRRVEVVVR